MEFHCRFDFYLLLWVILNIFSYIWVLCISFSPDSQFVHILCPFCHLAFFLLVLPFVLETVNILCNSCLSFNITYCNFCQVFKNFLNRQIYQSFMVIFQGFFLLWGYMLSHIFFLCIFFVRKFYWSVTYIQISAKASVQLVWFSQAPVWLAPRWQNK